MAGYKHYAIPQHFQSNPLTAPFVAINSALPKSDWFLWHEKSNATASLLSNGTHCPLGDVSCVERFALQSLFPGPLSPAFQPELISLLKGLSLEDSQKIATSTWKTIPRIDAAIHLR